MVTFSQPDGLRSRPGLKQLQAVQEEIYRQLQLLIPDLIAYQDYFASSVAGSPLLRMDVLERHNYTTFFRLTYEFTGARPQRFAPDAHIRFYHDARLAEATSFTTEQGCKRLAHPAIPPRQLAQRAWRENKALDRWLDYLLRQGHSVETMKTADGPIPVEKALETETETIVTVA